MLLADSDDQDFPVRVKFSQTIPLLSFSMVGAGEPGAGSLALISPPPAVLGGRITHNRDPLIMSFGDVGNQVLGLVPRQPHLVLSLPPWWRE